MRKEEVDLVNECIGLELNVSALYELFISLFPEDANFWRQMSKEERHHASLLELCKSVFTDMPEELLYRNIDELRQVNDKIKKLCLEYKNNNPSKEDAYLAAINLENSAFEFHYQSIVSSNQNSLDLKTFQELNKDDKDHAARIKALLD